jgi:hypothetical protein
MGFVNFPLSRYWARRDRRMDGFAAFISVVTCDIIDFQSANVTTAEFLG